MSVGQPWVRVPPLCLRYVFVQIMKPFEFCTQSRWYEYPHLAHRKRPGSGSFAIIAVIIIKWQVEIKLAQPRKNLQVLNMLGEAEEHGRGIQRLSRTNFPCELTRYQALWKRTAYIHLNLVTFLQGEDYVHIKRGLGRCRSCLLHSAFTSDLPIDVSATSPKDRLLPWSLSSSLGLAQSVAWLDGFLDRWDGWVRPRDGGISLCLFFFPCYMVKSTPTS